MNTEDLIKHLTLLATIAGTIWAALTKRSKKSSVRGEEFKKFLKELVEDLKAEFTGEMRHFRTELHEVRADVESANRKLYRFEQEGLPQARTPSPVDERETEPQPRQMGPEPRTKPGVYFPKKPK